MAINSPSGVQYRNSQLYTDFLESPIMQLMRHLQKFFEQDDIRNM